MIIAIDFDGTLVEHHFPHIGPLKQGAKEALLSFRKAGHKIIIWTCRHGEHEREVRKFMMENSMPFDSINLPIPGFDLASRKIYADVYIDDKGLRFDDNWQDLKKLIVGS